MSTPLHRKRTNDLFVIVPERRRTNKGPHLHPGDYIDGKNHINP